MNLLFKGKTEGKYRLRVKYTDPNLDSKFSNSIVFSTPKIPLNIFQYPPTYTTFPITVTSTKVETDTVTHRERNSNIVTLWTNAKHGLKVGNKVTLTNAASGWNGTFVISKIPSTKKISYKQNGVNVSKTSDTATLTRTYPVTTAVGLKVTLSIPKDVMKSLEWTSTVRDIPYFLIKVGSTVENMATSTMYYISNNEKIAIDDSRTEFTTTPKAYPESVQRKNANLSVTIDNSVYEFYYVITRYYKVNGSWVGYFPMVRNTATLVHNSDSTPASPSTVGDIIVSSAGVRV